MSKHGATRAKSWLYEVVNPITADLEYTKELVIQGLLHWSRTLARFEFIRPIEECIDHPFKPIYRDFCRDNEEASLAFFHYNSQLHSLLCAVENLHVEVIENGQEEALSKRLFSTCKGVVSTKVGGSIDGIKFIPESHDSISNLPSMVCLVNERDGFLKSIEDCINILYSLSHDLCSRYDIPAAPFYEGDND